MMVKAFLSITTILVMFLPLAAFAAPPIPARIGGSVTVNGVPLTQSTDTGYSFTVTRENNTLFTPAAEDTDGLNASDFYLVDIPIYDATEQTGGANPGDTAVIHVYKDSVELMVKTPASGVITVGNSGSTTQIDILVTSKTAGAVPAVNLLLMD